MIRCKDVARAIGAERMESSSPFKRLAVRLHLLFCLHCRTYRDQLRAIQEAARARLRHGHGQAEEEASLERRISEAIERRCR